MLGFLYILVCIRRIISKINDIIPLRVDKLPNDDFYHGLMLGLCALLGGVFVTSNRESGNGRYDIQLKPKKKTLPGILIELKAEKNCSEEQLKKISENALQKIIDKKYDTEMLKEGIQNIYRYGVAFSGKNVEITIG